MFSYLIPWQGRVLAVLLLALACSAAGLVAGLRIESDRRDAADLKRLRGGIKVADKESDRREAVAAKREVSREKIRVVYVKIKEEAQNNVEKNADAYAGCGLDDGGLRVWNAANSGSAKALRGQPVSAVSGSATGSVGEVTRPVGQPRGSGGAGGAVPGPAEETR